MFNAAEEGKTLRTTMKGGTGNGLEIMLDIQQDEYLPVWGDSGTLNNTHTFTTDSEDCEEKQSSYIRGF